MKRFLTLLKNEMKLSIRDMNMSVCPMWSTVCKVISVQTVAAI